MGLQACASVGALLGERRTRREAEAQSLWASSYVCMGGSRVAEQPAVGATKLRPYEEGRTRMAAEDHDGGRLPSANPTKVVHPLDDPARGLSSGNSVQGGPNTAGERHQALFSEALGLAMCWEEQHP